MPYKKLVCAKGCGYAVGFVRAGREGWPKCCGELMIREEYVCQHQTEQQSDGSLVCVRCGEEVKETK
jgi:hypothetical protein